MDRKEDMIATIIGHECAHAVARHSAEKLTLGLFVTAAAQLALAFFGGGQQGGPGGPGGRGGYGRVRHAALHMLSLWLSACSRSKCASCKGSCHPGTLWRLSDDAIILQVSPFVWWFVCAAVATRYSFLHTCA